MFMKNSKINKGFTLIELLVVIAIIGVLSSVVLASLNSARSKSRDARRKMDLKQLANATEIKFSNDGIYPASAGWFTNPNHGTLDAGLTPTYISKVSDDPGGNSVTGYQYWRKDYIGYTCMTLNDNTKFGYYAKLENPTAQDLATIVDSFDNCVKTSWGMNYKIGN
jgi:prepilin-type N-terminal cleavage/methylation domain-containing protein